MSTPAPKAAPVSLRDRNKQRVRRRILETARRIRDGIAAIPGLTVLGDPLWVIAFTSSTLDIFRVLDEMTQRGWHLNGLHRPPAVHLAVTQRHTQSGVAQRFLDDLAAATAAVAASPEAEGGMAPVYGMAATIPMRGLVGDLLRRYIDLLYKV